MHGVRREGAASLAILIGDATRATSAKTGILPKADLAAAVDALKLQNRAESVGAITDQRMAAARIRPERFDDDV